MTDSIAIDRSAATVPVRGVRSGAEIACLDQVDERIERHGTPALLADGHLTGRDAAEQPGQKFQFDRFVRELPQVFGP